MGIRIPGLCSPYQAFGPGQWKPSPGPALDIPLPATIYRVYVTNPKCENYSYESGCQYSASNILGKKYSANNVNMQLFISNFIFNLFTRISG